MANGQTLDPHAKVSDGQIKYLVSEETDVPRGETQEFGFKGRVYKGEIPTTITITEMMSPGLARCQGRCELKNCRWVCRESRRRIKKWPM